MNKFYVIIFLSASLSASDFVFSETPTFTVKPLLKTMLSGDDSKEVLVGRAEFSPGASTGVHTHPGDEYATVLQGTLELHVAGREPRRVSTGEAYHSPKGIVHETVNAGDGPAVVISTFVVEKGKPLVIPVIIPATASAPAEK